MCRSIIGAQNLYTINMKKNKLSVVLGAIVFLAGCSAVIGSLYVMFDAWNIYSSFLDFFLIFTSLLIGGISSIVYTIQAKFWISKPKDKLKS